MRKKLRTPSVKMLKTISKIFSRETQKSALINIPSTEEIMITYFLLLYTAFRTIIKVFESNTTVQGNGMKSFGHNSTILICVNFILL